MLLILTRDQVKNKPRWAGWTASDWVLNGPAPAAGETRGGSGPRCSAEGGC